MRLRLFNNLLNMKKIYSKCTEAKKCDLNAACSLSTGIKGKAIFTSKSGLFLMASKRLNLLYSNVEKYVYKNLKKNHYLSRVQMKSWAGKALETVNCCAFLQRGLIGAC
jgi:hypothetical protein